MRLATTVLASFGILAVAVLAHAAPQYSIVDLGLVPGGDGGTKAYAINSAGQVVGSDIGGTKSFLWTPGGGMRIVPELENDFPWVPSFNAAYDINDRGQVVGESNNAGFWWDSNTPDAAPMNLRKVHDSFFPYAINNWGIIAGKTGGNVAAVIMPGAGLRSVPLPPLGYAEGAARAVNSTGSVAGDIWRWEAGTGRDEWPEANLWAGGPASVNMGLLSAADQGSRGYGLNDLNHVVGLVQDPEWNEQAFFWSEAGGMQALAMLPGELDDGGRTQSAAYAVNNLDFIVGQSSGHAALWTPADGVLQLDQLLDGTGAGWVLSTARDINERGQIVGWGSFNDEPYHAYVMTPVPEPATAGLVGLAVLAIARRRRYPRGS